MAQPLSPPRVALIGDRSGSMQAHGRIPTLLRAALASDDPIEPYWLATTAIASEEHVAGFDGIWVVPGSPYANREGVLIAVHAARTLGIPYLGTCGGFQNALLEFARNECGLVNVEHAEERPGHAELLLTQLACKLFGEEAKVMLEGGTRAAALMGAGPSTERFFCNYGLNLAYLPALEARGLVVSGRNDNGDVSIAELPDHPFFLGALFQPELSSDTSWVHPLIAGFTGAVRTHAGLAQRWLAPEPRGARRG